MNVFRDVQDFFGISKSASRFFMAVMVIILLLPGIIPVSLLFPEPQITPGCHSYIYTYSSCSSSQPHVCILTFADQRLLEVLARQRS